MALILEKKHSKEKPESVIQRFKKAVIKSGIILEKRKQMFRERKKSRNLKIRSALRRLAKQKEYSEKEKYG